MHAPPDLLVYEQSTAFEIEQVGSRRLVDHVMASAVGFNGVALLRVPERMGHECALTMVQTLESPKLPLGFAELFGFSVDVLVQRFHRLPDDFKSERN